MPKKNQDRTPSTISKEEAIERATAQVSELVEIAPGRWCYHIWSDEKSAWMPALHADRQEEADRKRSSTIAALAVGTLLKNGSLEGSPEFTWEIVGLAYGPKNTGTVGERVDRILDGLG